MPDIFVILVVVVWIIGAVNGIRKAIAKSQATAAQLQAQTPAAVRPVAYSGVGRPPPPRGRALQQVARVIRAAAPQPVAQTFAEATAVSQSIAPQLSMTDMVAPSMPAFDTLSLAVDQMAIVSSSSPGGEAFGVAQLSGFALNTTGAAFAIIAAAVIGPPVGLRSGGGLAADW